ncbi:hypothetical protein MRS44_003547 [Fusarium solani]|uniref:uncharacterized protein n=1 Tax=Fusarium solani TaxID=169388 RepID=UPI0032C43B1A|nr:hypothetical protein MRS44_003547 [Fusarium solani]
MVSPPSKSTSLHPPQYEAVHDSDTLSDTNLIPDQLSLSRNPPSESSPPPVLRAHRSFWWQRVGLSGLLILIVGTIIMLGSSGILIFLWDGLHIGLIAAATAVVMPERTGVLLVDSPVLSIARATGLDPLNILHATLRRCIAGRGLGCYIS